MTTHRKKMKMLSIAVCKTDEQDFTVNVWAIQSVCKNIKMESDVNMLLFPLATTAGQTAPNASLVLHKLVSLWELFLHFNRYHFSPCHQALEAESTSHSRIASGISRASPAPSAPSHWWAPAFSLMATGSCAENATATYREVTRRLPTFPPWLSPRPSSQHFKNPKSLPLHYVGKAGKQKKNTASQVSFRMEGSTPLGPCRDRTTTRQSLLLHRLKVP